MLFRRAEKDPAERATELIAVIRQQNEVLEARQGQISTSDLPKREKALKELTAIGADAVPALISVLEAPRAELGTTPQAGVEWGVASDIAGVLGSIGDARAVGPLMDAAKQHIVTAPTALAMFPAGVDALFAGLDSPDELVRVNCIMGLGQGAKTDSERVMAAVKKTLHDPSAWVRKTAAQAALIRGVSDPELIAELDRMKREDPDQQTRNMAENAHARLTRG